MKNSKLNMLLVVATLVIPAMGEASQLRRAGQSLVPVARRVAGGTQVRPFISCTDKSVVNIHALQIIAADIQNHGKFLTNPVIAELLKSPEDSEIRKAVAPLLLAQDKALVNRIVGTFTAKLDSKEFDANKNGGYLYLTDLKFLSPEMKKYSAATDLDRVQHVKARINAHNRHCKADVDQAFVALGKEIMVELASEIVGTPKK